MLGCSHSTDGGYSWSFGGALSRWLLSLVPQGPCPHPSIMHKALCGRAGPVRGTAYVVAVWMEGAVVCTTLSTQPQHRLYTALGSPLTSHAKLTFPLSSLGSVHTYTSARADACARHEMFEVQTPWLPQREDSQSHHTQDEWERWDLSCRQKGRVSSSKNSYYNINTVLNT